MQQIKVILFDLGGVVVELVGIPTMLAWTNHRYTEEELWQVWLESPVVRRFETGKISAGQFAHGIVTELEMPVSADEFLAAYDYWPRGLYPGVPELFARLQADQRYVLACLSNTNALHWPRLMTEMGIEQLFGHHFASHEMGVLKPDRACFEAVLQTLECDAAEVLFLDDNEINVRGAQEAGLVAHRVKGLSEVEQLLASLEILN